MHFIDVKTVIFINVINNCLCTLVILSLWVQNRKRYDGTLFWLIDFGFQTAALFMIILRGSLSEWLSVILPNVLVISGAILGFIGLERFFEKKSAQVHNYALLLLFTCLQIYFTFISPSLSVRNSNLSLALLIVCAQCCWFVLRRLPPGQRKMARGTGIVFAGFCLVSIVRLFIIQFGSRIGNDFFKSDTYQMLVVISYQILLILLSYAFVLMVNRRLLAEITTQEEKFSKAFHSTPYGITLTRLADGRILEVNDGFVKITGYRYEDVVGKTTVDLRLWENEEDRATVVNELALRKSVREVEYRFQKKSGEIIIGLFSAELIMIEDAPWVLSIISDITERKQVEEEREKLIRELKEALSKIKRLSGLLPICSHRKKIRDDKGYWNQIEAYLADRSEAEFSHSICRECAEKYYPDERIYDQD